MSLRILIQELGRYARFLFFCFVTAPAVILFALLICTSIQGSLTGQFIASIKSITDAAPAGMVLECKHQELNAKEVPPKYVLTVPCERQPVDIDVYSTASDKMLLNYWMSTGIIIFLVRLTVRLYREETIPIRKSTKTPLE